MHKQIQKYKNTINQLKYRIECNSIKIGYIYECKIYDNDDIWYYIGSTNNYVVRKNQHIHCAKNNGTCPFYEMLKKINFDQTKYKFRIIKKMKNIFKNELIETEKYFIDLYKNENKNLLNVSMMYN